MIYLMKLHKVIYLKEWNYSHYFSQFYLEGSKKYQQTFIVYGKSGSQIYIRNLILIRCNFYQSMAYLSFILSTFSIVSSVNAKEKNHFHHNFTEIDDKVRQKLFR